MMETTHNDTEITQNVNLYFTFALCFRDCQISLMHVLGVCRYISEEWFATPMEDL